MLQAGWTKQQKFIFSQSGRPKSKLKMSAGVVSSEAQLLGLHLATAFLLCPHIVFLLCACISGVFVCPNFLLQGHPSNEKRVHSNGFILTQSLLSKYSHILGYWVFRLQHMNIGGHIIKLIAVNIQQQTIVHNGFILLFCFRKFWYYFIMDNYFKEIIIFLKKFLFLTTYV